MGRSRSSIDDVDDIEMVEPTLTSPLRYGYSHGSIGRFSEHSLHSAYRLGGYKTCDERCNDCLLRIPYATLIATIMCLVGVGTFIGTINRGATLTSLLMNEVFHFRTDWLEGMKILFLIMGVCTAALGLMILFVGCLATGATRHRVYRAWRARVSGRISCAVFLCISYVFLFIWLLLYSFMIIVTLHYTIFWGLCSSHRVQEELQCIDLTQFGFMFPNNSRVDDMKVCDAFEMKLFCKDYVEKAENMFILATTANLLVILSLVHYLMCLSANYAHIRDHEKFQELQELQYLTSPDGLTASRNRF